RQREHPLLPFVMEHRLLVLGLRIDRPEAVHAAEIVAAVHRARSRSLGTLARSTPIMALRVTRVASSSSLQPSVPAGRSGRTRKRVSEVESQTRISTC